MELTNSAVYDLSVLSACVEDCNLREPDALGFWV
jgi:hypothetical protein